MMINWEEVKTALSPIKDYEDLCSRFHKSFGYSFVREHFNFSIPELESYAQKQLGEDTRGRYTDYLTKLTRIFSAIHQAGVKHILDLKDRTASRERFELFVKQSGIPAVDMVSVLKYLVYWFIPGEKYLSGLVREDKTIKNAIKALGGLGIRTNLQLLEKGITASGRKSLAENSGLSIDVITGLVNRADFSRLPWSSKATISNIIGAGYASISELANANPENLYGDFFSYGKSIGKNLKYGQEIENSYRIAKIVPVLLESE